MNSNHKGTQIGFVILTWNSDKVIYECLSSIIRAEGISPNIVVVDNGSSDKTVDKIALFVDEQNDVNLKLIQLDANFGTTISRNMGLRYLIDHCPDIEYYCILDSDTEITGQSIRKMIHVLENDKCCGIIGPRMHDKDMVYQISGRNVPTISEKLLKIMPIKKLAQIGEKMQGVIPEEGNGCVCVGYLLSACWLMRASVMQEIGMLDENIFYAPEDVDYCIRCWKAGYRVMYCYDADILHHWQRLSRKRLWSKHNYEHIKGLIYLFRKHKYLFNNKQFGL